MYNGGYNSIGGYGGMGGFGGMGGMMNNMNNMNMPNNAPAGENSSFKMIFGILGKKFKKNK